MSGFDVFVASRVADTAPGENDQAAGWDSHPLETNTFTAHALNGRTRLHFLRVETPFQGFQTPMRRGTQAFGLG